MPDSSPIDLFVPLLLMTSWLILAQWLARWRSASLTVAVPDVADRAAPLDGLRGILALSVLIHHAAIHQQYWQNGEWVHPKSLTLTWLGPAPVAMFFMLTGFLFWGKALRGRRPEPIPLLLGRIRRIVPMYLAAGGVTFIIARALGGGSPPPGDTLDSLLLVISGGFFEYPFQIHGVPTTPINAGVTWTLRYEWYFYLALPGLVHWATRKGTHGLLLLAIAIAMIWPQPGVHCLNFALGMSAASWRESTHPFWSHWTGWRGGILCFIGWGLLNAGSGVQSAGSSLALAIPFTLIARGQSFGGLLVSPGARLLGQISYSIYLSHGIVLYLLFHLAHSWGWAIAPGARGLCGMAGFAGVLTILTSQVTYRWIEQPFIRPQPNSQAAPRPAVA